MKKKLVSIVLCMLMCVTTGVVAGNQTTDENSEEQIPIPQTTLNRDMWDVQFTIDIGGLTGVLYYAGVGFDGTYFFCPEWNSATIHQFNKDGTGHLTFTISGVSSLRDLAYDGTYFYGGDATGLRIWKMDMVTHSLVSTLTMPVAARSCAYDMDNDAFWMNVWTTDLICYSRTGTELNRITAPESLYGAAWDGNTQIAGYAGPFIWVFTGTSTGVDGIIKCYDIATKTLTTTTHNVAAELGAGIAGGLDISSVYEPGKMTLYGCCQGTANDYLFGYEISTTHANAPPETPAAPNGPATGFMGQEYTFIASTTDPDGDNLSYWFEWDDGENSGWVGPFASGAAATAAHTWDAAGAYDITVKARDEHGVESNVSAPHAITIIEGPILQIANITGGLFKVKATIKNVGGGAAHNINWSISLVGGLILLGKETTGHKTIIEEDEAFVITSKMIIGFGKTVVKVTASVPESSASEEVNATVLLFFIKV